MIKKNFISHLTRILAIFLTLFFIVEAIPNINTWKKQFEHPLNVSAEDLDPLAGTESSPKVAILDSGYNYEKGFDFCLSNIVDQFNVIDNSYNVDDDYGHGTTMLATLLGYEDEENNIQIEGINPSTEVVVIKVTNADGETTPEILAEGIEYAISQDVDIINISMGTPINNFALESAITDALNSDIEIVAAIGDSNEEHALYPARYNGVYAIGAQKNGTPYIYSNTCNKTIFVPGIGIDTIGYNPISEEWEIMSVSGSSIAAMIFTSTLAAESNIHSWESYKYTGGEIDIDVPEYISSSNTGEFYDNLEAEKESLSSLEHEFIIKYGSSVSIVNGKFEFNSNSCTPGYDEDEVEYINQNIETINNFIDSDIAHLDETGNVIFSFDENVLTQFGFKKVKFHWYGIDVTMDTKMLTAVSTISIIVNLVNVTTAKQFKEGQKPNLPINTITEQSKSILNLNNASSFSAKVGSKFYNKIISKCGTLDNLEQNILEIFSTLFTVATTIYIALGAATGGISSVILTVINYIIGLFTPSVITSIIALVMVFFGGVSSSQLKIRWFRGWGAHLYIS